MHRRFHSVFPLVCGTFAVGLLTVWSVRADTESKKRVAPPTFDAKRVEDTFFKDARTILVGPRPTGAAAGTAAVAAATTNTPTPLTPTDTGPTSPMPAAGEFKWSVLISPETLQDEIKSYKPLLEEKTRTPSAFKSGNQEVRKYFSVLAAMFLILEKYDGDVRATLKSQAAAARELFGRTGFNSKSATDQSFNEAKQRTADLQSLLNGESISPPPNLDPPTNYAQRVAGRSMLMRRFEEAHDKRLKGWTSSPDEFRKNADKIKHEAELIAALAQIIQHESYDFADDESYRGYAEAMKTGALAVIEGVKQKNADQATKGVSMIGKACSDCHGDFR